MFSSVEMDKTDMEISWGIGYFFFEAMGETGREVERYISGVRRAIDKIMASILQQVHQFIQKIIDKAKLVAEAVCFDPYREVRLVILLKILVKHLTAKFREQSCVDMIVNLYRKQERGVDGDSNGDITSIRTLILA